MTSKIFVVVTSGDKEVSLGVSLRYSLNAAKNGWMDEVKVILFGPAERLVAGDEEVLAKVKELVQAGIEVLACKSCLDDWADGQRIAEALESVGVRIIRVGAIISQRLKDGWASLTF
ncbi:MAG: DsrE family protein [Dehalococcoidales bacterium]|nr:DsrE family protein [Dehalococcoidales bacterium]